MFFVSAAVVLVGAIGVVTMRNPVHAALSLVLTLFGISIQFINLEAYFLAAVQVIVYAGAIVVLFLFVIMLLGVDKSEDIRAEPIIAQRQFAALAAAGLLVLGVLVAIAFSGDLTGVPQRTESPTNGGLAIDFAVENENGFTVPPEENVRDVGRVLFTEYVFAFEITAILLTIAVVGAVVLARRPTGELEDLPEAEPSWGLVSSPVPPLLVDDDTAADDGAEASDDSDGSDETLDSVEAGGSET